jgi:hypothetical protein
MWLRDFLSKDLPHCRTMIYGYNSKLSSHGVDTIMDYDRELIEEIKKVRDTDEVSTDELVLLDGLQPASITRRLGLLADKYDLLAETAATLLHCAQFWRYYSGSCRSLIQTCDCGAKPAA